jgi:hypothetical protein
MGYAEEDDEEEIQEMGGSRAGMVKRWALSAFGSLLPRTV